MSISKEPEAAILPVPGFNLEAVREQFPVLSQKMNGKPLVFLDNAASTQKPIAVLKAMENFQTGFYSNIHRGVYRFSAQATEAYESVRHTVKNFINAPLEEEIIFTSGTTDSINLVANILSSGFLKPGDEILITEMEHHSNIVPWHIAAEKTGAILKVASISGTGELDLELFEYLLSPQTKVAAFNQVSNSLGTINPVKKMTALAKEKGALVLIDGAQAVQHLGVDVQELGCDFYVFSGHKIYGPTGTGVLWGKKSLLDKLPPYRGGGDMIKSVSFSTGITYNELPFKYEAGTPNITGIIGLGAALVFVESIGLNVIRNWEEQLVQYTLGRLQKELPDIHLIGTATKRTGVISFLAGKTHPYDIGVLLDQMGIAVRTGHHCTQPVMEKFNIPGTVRASFGLYNTMEDVDRFVTGLQKSLQMLGE